MKFYSFQKTWLIAVFVAVSSIANAQVVQDTVRIPVGDDVILGVLYFPNEASSDNPVPGILCLQGGGHVGLDNYLYEPKYFAEHGYVGLVCDKAGEGGSRGPSNWRQQSFEDKTQEYFALLRYLKSLPFVDSNCVGVHGMSEGGRLAVHMAALAPEEVAFAINVSGPIESYMENQLYAIEHLLLDRGEDRKIVDRVLHVWDGYFRGIAEQDIPGWVADSVRSLRTNSNSLYLPAASTRLPSRPLPEDIHFNNIEEVKSIRVPVLFQYGAEDHIVDPHTSIELLGESELFAIKLYEDTDHNMTIDGNVHEEYDGDKVEWLEAVVAGR